MEKGVEAERRRVQRKKGVEGVEGCEMVRWVLERGPGV
jgi:hypothetical protein